MAPGRAAGRARRGHQPPGIGFAGAGSQEPAEAPEPPHSPPGAGHLPVRSQGGAMVLELDSMEQAATWQRFVAAEPAAASIDGPLPPEFSGQVRLPYLYGNRLVVTDAQLFDGVLMLAAGPTGIAELLGSMHRSDLIVMLRAGSARESLDMMLANPSFYSSAGLAGFSAATLSQRREDWIKAIDHRRVGSAPWRTIPFAQELAARLGANPPSAVAGDGLVTALVATTNRSQAKRTIESSGADATARRVVFDWWNGAYMDVLARQHGSVWITTLSPGAASRGDGTTTGATLAIPQVIVDLLSSMSGPDFARLVADSAPVLAKLRSRKRVLDRLRLALLVLDVGAPPQPLSEFVALVARILTFALLIVSTLVDTGSAVKWWAVSLAIALVVAQLPFLDIRRFLGLFRRSSRAIMKTPAWSHE